MKSGGVRFKAAKDWKSIQLGELASFRNGINFTSDSFGSGLPILGVSDFGERSVPDYEGLAEVSERALSNEEAILVGGDIVAVRSNGNPLLVGRTMFIERPPRVTHSAFTIRIRVVAECRKQLLPKFLAYVLRGPVMRAVLSNEGHGTNISNLNQGILSRLPLLLPPLLTQYKIAAVLSAYDDLIENNNLRIKLLEEIAQRIYREWFVDFRYPGRDNVPLVDSELGPIPEGWTVRGLFDVADITFGFPFKSDLFNTDQGLPVIRIRDIPTGQSATRTTESPAATYRVVDGDILIGMDGDFHMGRWSAGEAWLNQRVARLRVASGAIDRYALYLSLEKPIRDWNRAIVGTTVAHLGKRHLELIKVLTTSTSLVPTFAATLEPIFDLEMGLRKATHQLRTIRDLLLPRLISGETDVTDLDIAMPAAAA